MSQEAVLAAEGVASLTPSRFAELAAQADEGCRDSLVEVLRRADLATLRVGASTVLHATVSVGSPEGVRTVVACLRHQAHGADAAATARPPGLDDLDGMGFAPLHAAVETGFAECIAPLLEGNADVEVCTADAKYQLGQTTTMYVEGGRTPLHIAAERSRPAAVASLLAGGASVAARDSFGRTPREIAVEALAVSTAEVAARTAELFGLSPTEVAAAQAACATDVKTKARERQRLLQHRILEAQRREDAAARRRDAIVIRERYTPLDPSLMDGLGAGAVGSEVASFFVGPGGVDGARPARGALFQVQLPVTGPHAGGVAQPHPGVFVFRLLSEALCARLWAETEHYHATALERDLPLPVRHDGGLDLSRVFPKALHSIADAARPAIRTLLPPELHDVELRHAFRTKNYVGRDESFKRQCASAVLGRANGVLPELFLAPIGLSIKRHVDKYAVTLNVCLHKTADVVGSGVFFYASGSPELPPAHRHEHEVGLAVLHASKAWHETEPLTAGERGSVIIWLDSPPAG